MDVGVIKRVKRYVVGTFETGDGRQTASCQNGNPEGGRLGQGAGVHSFFEGCYGQGKECKARKRNNAHHERSHKGQVFPSFIRMGLSKREHDVRSQKCVKADQVDQKARDWQEGENPAAGHEGGSGKSDGTMSDQARQPSSRNEEDGLSHGLDIVLSNVKG